MVTLLNSNGEQFVRHIQKWVESIVVGLNLCPFAKKEVARNRVRYAVTDAVTWTELSVDLEKELAYLVDHEDTETTLLIIPKMLSRFDDYLDYLDTANRLLTQMNLEGVVQIASFHPDYQFEGEDENDISHYTNRAPLPVLHLIREESLEKVLRNYPNADEIPINNINKLNGLGRSKVLQLLSACK